MTTYKLGDTLLPKGKVIPVQKWVPLLRDTLAREGRFYWQVEGQSMLPTLSPGDTIEIHEAGERVRLGDLVVFAEKDALVVHRLAARRGRLFIFQGDNRTVADAPVAVDQVIGRVAGVTRHTTLIYPHKFLRVVAGYWIVRYYWHKAVRVLQRRIYRRGKG